MSDETNDRPRDWTEGAPANRRDELRLVYAHFAQLAEACGARNGEEDLAGFLKVMCGLLDIFDDSRLAAWSEGHRKGAAGMHRLMADDWDKGPVAGAKVIARCSVIEAAGVHP
jgi:hypothetical protein